MERKAAQDYPQLADNAIHTTVLADWLQATTTFYIYYNQLSPYVNQKEVNHINSNQCPVDQLKTLIHRMQNELKKLLCDLESVGTLNSHQGKQMYRKLATHTRVLNRLNQQAKVMTLLTTLTAS